MSALFGGAALIGQSAWLAGCATMQRTAADLFSPSDLVLLDEVAETILPETQTPGAKAAGGSLHTEGLAADVAFPAKELRPLWLKIRDLECCGAGYYQKNGRELCVRVDGQLTYNTTAQMLIAALAGLGLAYVPEGLARPHIARGKLKHILADWCPPFSGYHLYYPSRRQPSAAFALLVEALRHRQ